MTNKEIITLKGKDVLVEFDYETPWHGDWCNPPEGGYEICEVSWEEDGKLLSEEELNLFEEEILCELEKLRKEAKYAHNLF